MVNLVNLWIGRIPDDIQQDLDVTWGVVWLEQVSQPTSTNFTADELDLARKMQQAGKTQEEFLTELPEYREFRDRQDVEEEVIEKTPEQIESEQWLGWFGTETT